MKLVILLLIITKFSLIWSAEVPTPKWDYMESGGLRVRIDHQEGQTEVQVHFNLNKPLSGVSVGDYNVLMNSPTTPTEWIYEDPSIPAVPGDSVYYWILVIVNGEGFQKTEQSGTVLGPTTTKTTTKTSTTSTTTTSTTTSSVDQSTTTGSGTTTSSGHSTTTTIPDVISVTESSEGKYYAPGELIFEDNFDTLDFKKWQHELTLGGGGNWEFQAYVNSRNNSYTRDGILYLKPSLTTDRFGDEFIMSGEWDMWGGMPADYCTSNAFYGCKRTGSGTNIINPITSARLRTINSFSFVYGKVEVRAKVPVGDWLWPAIWLLPRQLRYGQWPASGEIDIMESRGNRDLTLDGVNIGVEQVGSTLHFGGGWPENAWPKAHGEIQNENGWHSDFHRYQLEWTPDFIQISVDDTEIMKTATSEEGGFWELGGWDQNPAFENPWRFARNQKMAPFDEQFYIILNVAVGGTGYFPDEAVNGGSPKPWNNESPQAAFDFWSAKDQWMTTWNPNSNGGEDAAMQVDYVRIWASDIVRP